MFIAHIREDSNQTQSVAEHNCNAAKLAEEACCIEGLKTAAYLAGMLHDAGKNTPEFNEYILRAKQNPSSVRRGEVVHSSAGGYLISELADENNGTELLAAEMIREAIISHHSLYDCVTPDGVVSYDKRMEKEIPIDIIRREVYSCISKEELTKLFKKTVSEIDSFIDENIAIIDKKNPTKFGNKHFYFGMSERMLMSLLIDADRIDTACFMNDNPLPQRQTTQEIIEMWERLSLNLEEKLITLNTDNNINLCRKEISQLCYDAAKKESSIFRLVVPTGAGKTLSSFRYALNHAKLYGKKHIIYIAPYNSILEQNAVTIREAIKEGNAVLEHHCNIVNEEEGEDARYKELTGNWEAPIIITTAVQFLHTLFSAKTSSVRRMHSLAESVIIIDEIQALPIKCVGLFNLAANYLLKICNSSIVLCSATQPLLDKLEENSLIEPDDMISDSEEYFMRFKRTMIIDKTNKILNIEELAYFTLEKMNDSNSILVIVNTKSCARNLYERLEELIDNTDEKDKVTLFHLSTNMCAAHRKKTLNAVRESLDKSEKMICISTQLIEAGVDISFETVIRSFGGLDNIVQAAGRCNRNCENKIGKVFIVKIADEDVSKLPDIKMAQESMNEVLNVYQNRPELIDNDLLSKKAMDLYYTYYFMNRKFEMNYNIPDIDSNIVDLLSVNHVGLNNLKRKENIQRTKLILKQAFKTAGEYFQVINDKGMFDIVVDCDDESRSLICEMNSEISMKRQISLIRELQIYSVSISDAIKKSLIAQGALFPLKNGGIFTLKREFYNDKIGVCVKSSVMELYFS